MRLGLLYVLSVPYVAGFACFGGPYIGGFRLTGWVFVLMLATAPLVFMADKTPSRFPIWFWIPWITVVLLSIAWASRVGLRTLQDAFQTLTPFVIAVIASKSIKTSDHLDALLRAFTHCTVILVVGLALNQFLGVHILMRPMSMTAAIAGCVFVAQFPDRPRHAVMGWAACLLVSGVTGSRMATLALLLQWLILPRFRRQASRVLAAGLISAIAVTLFYTPMFQERFFGEKGEGTLEDVYRGEFSSTGRFEVWAKLWPEVAKRPLLGAGPNGSAPLVSAIWEGLDKPHNDYLRILLEQGVVGLSFFILGVIAQIFSLWALGFSGTYRQAVIRSAAYMAILVFVLMAVTDNPIIYGVWFMHPLFVLIATSYSPALTSPAGSKELP